MLPVPTREAAEMVKARNGLTPSFSNPVWDLAVTDRSISGSMRTCTPTVRMVNHTPATKSSAITTYQYLSLRAVMAAVICSTVASTAPP